MQKSLRRRLLRLAVMIHEHAMASSAKAPVALPRNLWERCERLARQANLARKHAFTAAERLIRAELALPLHELASQLETESKVIETSEPPGQFAAPLEIYRDLVALFDEFPGVSWSANERTLSVTTDPVWLEAVELGCFEVRLHWDQLDRSYAYEMIAVDAHPAACDGSITHPHVQDGTLCEGAARSQIRHALDSGRLLDFFQIVRCVLTTYNSGGAYVLLERWDGVHCPDCADLVPTNELSSCICGRQQVCEACCSSCVGCSQVVCGRCSDQCSKCGDLVCTGCSELCDGCGVTVCPHCQNGGRCESCEKVEIQSESHAS